MRVCLTGKMLFSRSVTAAHLEHHGFHVDPSVTKLTGLLVMGEKPGGRKLSAATGLGVSATSEEAFWRAFFWPYLESVAEYESKAFRGVMPPLVDVWVNARESTDCLRSLGKGYPDVLEAPGGGLHDLWLGLLRGRLNRWQGDGFVNACSGNLLNLGKNTPAAQAAQYLRQVDQLFRSGEVPPVSEVPCSGEESPDGGTLIDF